LEGQPRRILAAKSQCLPQGEKGQEDPAARVRKKGKKKKNADEEKGEKRANASTIQKNGLRVNSLKGGTTKARAKSFFGGTDNEKPRSTGNQHQGAEGEEAGVGKKNWRGKRALAAF